MKDHGKYLQYNFAAARFAQLHNWRLMWIIFGDETSFYVHILSKNNVTSAQRKFDRGLR